MPSLSLEKLVTCGVIRSFNFSPHDACVWQCVHPNGYLNGLSDEQPWTSWGVLFSDPDISALLWMSSSMPPPSELSSHALCVSSRSSPFAVSHHQHHRHHPHHHHHSTCDSFFSTSICHVTLTFASKRVKQRNVGASPCFGWTEIFPSFCQSGDLLAHDVHIDKPKAWCQQKRARSHVGFRTEWSPASPVTQLPFVSPLLKWLYSFGTHFSA